MKTLTLTYAGLLYLDRTLPLLTGEVAPSGVSLDYQVFPRVEALFRRQASGDRFPVSEMSLGTHTIMTSRDAGSDLVGLPLFVSRHFRHREVYVNADARISVPADLRGKRIGVPEYQMTAAIWVRALLQHEYGISPAELEWFSGGLREPSNKQRLAIDLPSDIRLSRIGGDESLEGLLADGRIDALITTETPRIGRDRVTRLFADFGGAERDYYARTGIFPIMHLVALRRDVYEEHPWLVTSLLDAFDHAKRAGGERLRFQPSLPVGLPWLQEDIEELDRSFDGDAFPYGVAANSRVLELILDYCDEQGLTSRRVGVEELFAPEALSWESSSRTDTASPAS